MGLILLYVFGEILAMRWGPERNNFSNLTSALDFFAAQLGPDLQLVWSMICRPQLSNLTELKEFGYLSRVVVTFLLILLGANLETPAFLFLVVVCVWLLMWYT